MLLSINQNNIRYSIVNEDSTEVKRDQTTPLSYVDFLNYGQFDMSNQINFIEAYRQYVREWLKISKNRGGSDRDVYIAAYKQLLLEIQLSYVNDDERRYLEQFDINDPLELDIVIPFYVEKIKEITLYFLKKRYELENVKFEWSSRGSKRFIENVVKRFILQNYTKTQNTFENYKSEFVDLSSLQVNFSLDYEELYDLADYKEVVYGELTPSSNDDVKGIYRKYLIENVDVLSGGEVVETINSETQEYNMVNTTIPYISLSSNDSNTIGEADLGGYFKPQYIQAATYFSPIGITTGGSGNDEFKDFFFWSKFQPSYQGLQGKPVREKGLKRFYGYVSRSEMLDDSTSGISRYTDNISNWFGDKGELWDNEDVFKKYNDVVLNKVEKTDTFFNLADNEGVTKYVVDIYGNEFSLIKTVKANSNTQSLVYPLIRFDVGDIDLIGQSIDSISLSAIDINSIALGYYTGATATQFDELSDYNSSVDYFSRDDTLFNSKINTSYPSLKLDDGAMQYSEYSSIYEQEYKVGRVHVKTVDGGRYFNLEDILNEEIVGVDFSRVLDIDILFDILIVRTDEKIAYTKINYNYNTSEITLSTLVGRHFDNNITSLHKTGDIWYDGGDYVYFCDVNAEVGIIPLVNRLNIKTLQLTNVFDELNDAFYDLPDFLHIDSISRPSITKHNKSDKLAIVVLVKDIFKNYYYAIYTFTSNINDRYALATSKIVSPGNLLITPNITSYPPDNFPALSSHYSDIVNEINNNRRVYYSVETRGISTDLVPFSEIASTPSYNVDRGFVVDQSYELVYNLGQFADIQPVMSVMEQSTMYTYELGDIYGPCDIEFDLLSLNSFQDIITSETNVYSMVYDIDGEILGASVLSDADVDGGYNTTFSRSPINGKNVVKRFDGNREMSRKRITVDLYSLNSGNVTIVINFNLHSIDINNRFTDINLLDSRYFISEGVDWLKLYINTRNPDYITGVEQRI